MSNIAIRVDHLGRAQGRHDTSSTRLRAASLWDRTGIGRNGAGKSTLPSAGLRARLKILSRITEPPIRVLRACVI